MWLQSGLLAPVSGYWDFRLSSPPHSQDPWAPLPNEKKCSLCNLDLTAGLGDNVFSDFPVKMEFFFRNSDSQRAELETPAWGEEQQVAELAPNSPGGGGRGGGGSGGEEEGMEGARRHGF